MFLPPTYPTSTWQTRHPPRGGPGSLFEAPLPARPRAVLRFPRKYGRSALASTSYVLLLIPRHQRSAELLQRQYSAASLGIEGKHFPIVCYRLRIVAGIEIRLAEAVIRVRRLRVRLR